MKKIFIFSLFFSLFFPCFSDDEYFFSNYWKFSGSTTTKVGYNSITSDFTTIQLVAANFPRAIRMDIKSGSVVYNSNSSIPALDSFPNFIRCVSNGSLVPFNSYPVLIALDNIACGLVHMGFTNVTTQAASLSYDFQSQNNLYLQFNCRVLNLIGAALSSTNTPFRSYVLDHLDLISSDVRQLVLNSSSGLGSLSSLLGVSSSAADSLSSIDSSIDLLLNDVRSILDRVYSDPYVSDFTNSINFLLSHGKISSDFASSVLNTYSSIDSPLTRALFASTVKSRVDVYDNTHEFINEIALEEGNLTLIGGFLNTDVVDALIGDYDDPPSRGSKSVSTRTSIKSQLKSWREEVKKQLEDWKADLSKQLEDWKTSDQSGYLNIRNSISNNFETTRKDSNGNDSHEYFTDHLDRTWNDSNHFISNSFDFISKTYYQNISNTITHLFDSSGAIPVEIKEPIDGAAVLVRDPSLERFSFEFMNVMSNFTDLVFSQPIHVQMTNSFDFLDDWLEEWRKWVDEDTFYELSQSFYDFKGIWETNALPFFADYRSSFIEEDNNFYKSAFDIVRGSSHSNVLDRLCFYGLSTEPESGNFFNLFTSFALLQSEIAASLLDAKDLVNDLASSSSWFDGFSVFSAARQVSDSIPSRSRIEQIVATASEGTNLVLSSSTDLLDSFGLITNLSSHVFSVFRTSSTSLPDYIVLFHLRTSPGISGSSVRDVTIPVGTVPALWLTIRLAIAFGICAVNIILFPKFLLKLALLFMPLFKKSLPFLKASS